MFHSALSDVPFLPDFGPAFRPLRLLGGAPGSSLKGRSRRACGLERLN
jgi:CRISPR/Cas system CSM-associated protein Csm3 (group 7 of RAMP superfamily)